jgi:hypothetical protein
LARLYGWEPKSVDDYASRFNNSLNLPFQYATAGHYEYAYSLVVIEDSEINAYYKPEFLEEFPTARPEWRTALEDFARRAGLKDPKIGWYLYASYG